MSRALFLTSSGDFPHFQSGTLYENVWNEGVIVCGPTLPDTRKMLYLEHLITNTTGGNYGYFQTI